MKKDVFIITKPLQYFNATNIKCKNEKICLITDNFFNAENIFKKIKKESLIWDDVLFFKKWDEPYKWIIKNKDIVNYIFIDSDFGFQKNFYLKKIKPCNIYVYEEGIGTYNEYKGRKGIFSSLLNKLYFIYGNQLYLGTSKYVDGIFLYNIEKYLKKIPHYNKELFYFQKPFCEHLETFSDANIFLDQETKILIQNLKNKKIVLYLSSWSEYSDINNKLSLYPNHLKIYKPHPHIKETNNILKKYFDYILRGNILIELFITQLISVCEELVVIHHGSSAIMYFNDSKKLKSILLNEK